MSTFSELQDWIQSREFYDFMQAYRTAPREKPADTVEAFERVKTEILRHAAPPAPSAARCECGVCDDCAYRNGVITDVAASPAAAEWQPTTAFELLQHVTGNHSALNRNGFIECSCGAIWKWPAPPVAANPQEK